MSERNLESTVEMFFPMVEVRETNDIKIASLQLQGQRKTQEDRSVILQNEEKQETTLILLDAHGENGVEVADELLNFLEEKISRFSADTISTLESTFADANKYLEERNLAIEGGAVVTVCSFQNGIISFGYVGDVELRMVSENGTIKPSLTPPHDYTNADEIERLQKMKLGFGSDGYLGKLNENRAIAPSRVIGDIDIDGAICTPDYGSEIFLDKFAIVASDGFWKIIRTSKKSGKKHRMILEEILEKETEPEVVLQKFLELFSKWELSDNLTISIIKHK